MHGLPAPGAARRPRVISMFSGMEAASVAAHPLGWEFLAFAEVEPAACWTLNHHYGCGRPRHMPRPEDGPSPKDARERQARIKAVAALPEPANGAPLNLGEMTQVDWSEWQGQVDIVVGGPPCQAFSFAGLRKSMDDARGNLSLAYVRAIHAIRPLWAFTENVPGMLTTKDNAFGCYLGALVGADSPLEPPDGKRWGSAGIVDGPLYRAAWRVIDAQGFLPQRRRRLFLVAARADSRGDPVRVLFETEAEALRHLGERAHTGPLFPLGESGERHPGSGGEAREGAAGPAAQGIAGGGGEGLNGAPVAFRVHAAFSTAMMSNGKARAADPVEVARALDTCGGFATNQGGNIVVQKRTGAPGEDAGAAPEQAPMTDGADPRELRVELEGEARPLPIAFSAKDYGGDAGTIAPTLRAAPHHGSHANSGSHVGIVIPKEPPSTVSGNAPEARPSAGNAGIGAAIVRHLGILVRRLTPGECLALQGFPAGYLDGVRIRGKELADGPRYKLIGNSWAVPVIHWIFARLDENLTEQFEAGEQP